MNRSGNEFPAIEVVFLSDDEQSISSRQQYATIDPITSQAESASQLLARMAYSTTSLTASSSQPHTTMIPTTSLTSTLGQPHATMVPTPSLTASSSQPHTTMIPTTSLTSTLGQPHATMVPTPSLTASSSQPHTTMVPTISLPEGSRQLHTTMVPTRSLTSSSSQPHTTMVPTTSLTASSGQPLTTLVPTTSFPEGSRPPHVTMVSPTTSLTESLGQLHATMVPTPSLLSRSRQPHVTIQVPTTSQTASPGLQHATMVPTPSLLSSSRMVPTTSLISSSIQPLMTTQVPTPSLLSSSRQPHVTIQVPTTSLTARPGQLHATMVPTSSLTAISRQPHRTMVPTTSFPEGSRQPHATMVSATLLPEGSRQSRATMPMVPTNSMTTSSNHSNVTNMVPTISQAECSRQPHATMSNSSHGSPPIKRMRQQPEEHIDEDESTWCPICLESWTCTGEHRIVSINCGHVFGRKCIHRWISKGNRKCPTCNCKAVLKHIRNIFAPKLIAVDNSQLNDALKNLTDEKKKRTEAEKHHGQAVINAQVAESRLQNIQKKMLQLETQHKIPEMQKPRSVLPTLPQMDDQMDDEPKLPEMDDHMDIDKKYVMVDTYPATSGSKTLSHQQISMDLVYSMCEGRNYGFHKIDIHVGKKSFFSIRNIHTNLIMDASFHDEAYNTLLSASCDNTMKLTSLNTNLPVQTIHTPYKVWSCAWQASDVTKIYAGLGDGKILLYDTRNTSDPVRSYFKDGNPIVSLEYIPKGRGVVRSSGLLMCTTKLLCFWEEVTPTRHVPRTFPLPEGENTCMRVEPTTKKILVSQRYGQENLFARHTVMEFQTEADQPVSCGNLREFKCGKQGHKCGSTLYRAPFDQDSLLVAAADEETSRTHIWNERSGSILQNVVHGFGHPRNILGFKAGSSNDMMAFLKNDILSLFKWS